MTANPASDGHPPSPVQWAAVDAWSAEPDDAAAARARIEAEGAAAPSRAQCSALRLFATLAGAEDALMLGCTGGVAESWVLDGLAPQGTLTVIDDDPHRQALTRDALSHAPSTAARVITARASEVLPRLADTGYDLVIVDDEAALAGDLEQAPRLLRPGGTLVIRLGDHEGSRPLRDIAASIREDPRWTASWLTVGEGLLVAAWHGEDPAEESAPSTM